MKVVFCSNFLNHHQLPFCLEMHKFLNGSFYFVATTSLPEEQLSLGYLDLNKEYSWVIRAYEDDAQKELALELSAQADVVIIGSAPKEYVLQRLTKRKLTFLYSERIYKRGFPFWKWPIYMWHNYKTYGKYKSFYLLCASAYTAKDFAKTRTFMNKAYKWGYFPEVKHYENVDKLIEDKQPASIMWAGRFIDWKHPEYAIEIARRLKADGFCFRMNLIGNGVLVDAVQKMVQENDLEKEVRLLGAMPPDRVREYMEQASIYLFTSDRNEGWGAVLNEAMNSGCAVVASDAIGAVPFLLKDNENGIVYQNGNLDDLYKKVKTLLTKPLLCKNMGNKAYRTMQECWNAKLATQRLYVLSHALLNGETHPCLFEEGPCSRAKK